MKLASRFRSWCHSILYRRQFEQEMNEELQFHIENYIEDLVRSGLVRSEAERRARIEFGNIEAYKEECRENLGLRLWDEFLADLRYALRGLRQSPAFTAVAIVSLALGIGANTAIFALAEDALLKSLPVSHPNQLRLLSWVSGPRSRVHHIWGDYFAATHGSTAFSYPVFKELQRRGHAFQSLFAFKELRQLTTVVNGQAEQATGELISGNVYEALGIHTVAGRPIMQRDDYSHAPVAVISDSFWARRFGRSASSIGQQIEVNRTLVTIVGVNPPGFIGLNTGFFQTSFYLYRCNRRSFRLIWSQMALS